MTLETHSIDAQERQKQIVLLIIGLIYSISVAYLFASLPNQRYTDDFFPRWYASNMLLTTGRSLYDWTNATELVDIVGWPLGYQLAYYYPAYLLLFTAPLAMIPYELARFIWTFLGLWCIWLGIAILARSFGPVLSINRLTLLLGLVTVSVPVLQHTLNAQFNALGVLALALTYWALYRQHYLLAGILAGGLLFKPQATVVPLILFLVWSILKPERRLFWIGLGGVSLSLWGLAELLEPNWVFTFLQALGQYEPTPAVVDNLWNPYRLVSLILLAVTIWFIFRGRHLPATAPAFGGLLVWSLCINSLIVPLFGMLHMVIIGAVFVILLNGFVQVYPAYAQWVWFSVIGLFIAGLLAFVTPLVLLGSAGLQITISEMVYKITMPTVAGLASLLLIFSPNLRESGAQ